MSRVCREKFISWALKNKLIPDADTPIHGLREWNVWESAWYVAQSYGAEKQRQKFKKINVPLTDEEMKQLFLASPNGKEFGRMLEERHGIK